MAVYLINLLLILLFGYALTYKNSSENNTKFYCGIVALQWILISGLRHVSVGADTKAYAWFFEDAKTISWKKAFTGVFDYVFRGDNSEKDPGYTVFQKICQIFTNDYQIFLLIIALLFTGFMAVWIYRNSSMPMVSYIIYSTLFYSFFALTGHRQTIATALIVFWGYKYIKERKLIKFLILAFIAFVIHKSSVVFIPFYFIANIPITIPYVIIALIVISVIVVFGRSFYGVVAEALGYTEDQVAYDGGGAEFYALVLTLLCVITLVLYMVYKDKTEKATHIFNITLLTLMSSLLVMQHQGFMRIQQYYSLFIMISFPEVINSFREKDRPLVSIGAMGVLVVYLFLQSPQYLFFWQ